jgi:hypothetical protein
MSGYAQIEAQLRFQWEMAEREAKLRRENAKLMIALGMSAIVHSITLVSVLSGSICQ